MDPCQRGSTGRGLVATTSPTMPTTSTTAYAPDLFTLGDISAVPLVANILGSDRRAISGILTRHGACMKLCARSSRA